MISVRSSVISAIDYDANNSILYVVIKPNKLYKYRRVPVRVFENFLKSRSKGTYFTNYVKGRFTQF